MRPSAVVFRRRAYQAVDGVAVRQRLAQRLQQQGAYAFAAHIAVGSLAEGLAAAIRAEHPGLLERDEASRAQQ